MGAALADAAVGDDFVFAIDALGVVEFFQIVVRLKGAVFVGRLCPGNVRGLGNVAGTLGSFGHARRGDNLAGKFINGANVDELAGLATFDDGEDFFLAGAEGIVNARNVIGRGGDFGGILCERSLFLEPLFDALFGRAAALLSGEVEIGRGAGRRSPLDAIKRLIVLGVAYSEDDVLSNRENRLRYVCQIMGKQITTELKTIKVLCISAPMASP